MKAFKVILFIINFLMALPIFYGVIGFLLMLPFIGLSGDAGQGADLFLSAAIFFFVFAPIAGIVLGQMARLVKDQETFPMPVLVILWILEIMIFFIPIPAFKEDSPDFKQKVQHNLFDMTLRVPEELF